MCEIINYQTFDHPPPHRCAWGGERGDRMFEQLGDSRSVWGWGGGYVGEMWGVEEILIPEQ